MLAPVDQQDARMFDFSKTPFLQQAYGTTAEFDITLANKVTDAPAPTFDHVFSITLPQRLIVDRPNIDDPKPAPDQAKTFTKNQTVTWEPDKDEAPVYILISRSHDPFASTETPELASASFNFFSVPDNGSYTFSQADFPEVPDNAFVTIYLMRFSSRNFEDGAVARRQHFLGAITATGGKYQLINGSGQRN